MNATPGLFSWSVELLALASRKLRYVVLELAQRADAAREAKSRVYSRRNSPRSPLPPRHLRRVARRLLMVVETAMDRALTAVAATAFLGAISVWLQGVRLDALVNVVTESASGAAAAAATAAAGTGTDAEGVAAAAAGTNAAAVAALGFLQEAVMAGAGEGERQGGLPRSTALWGQWLTQVGVVVLWLCGGGFVCFASLWVLLCGCRSCCCKRCKRCCCKCRKRCCCKRCSADP